MTSVPFLPQAQAGWLQHDFGHLSVFKKSVWNHIVHKFVIGHLKVKEDNTLYAKETIAVEKSGDLIGPLSHALDVKAINPHREDEFATDSL